MNERVGAVFDRALPGPGPGMIGGPPALIVLWPPVETAPPLTPPCTTVLSWWLFVVEAVFWVST
ncbi:hypothetical protein [Saccharothrix sp. ST-888]|uniref:hypothetical protein n=1 Tax=Saccharothrix sp. ST-888 TaxID=1427391 RepID=UPI0005ED14AC|nr:hypothetical protein [Saccharothrix sp. ST-888]KJK58403.1 hypothetical protein UK12_10865 [Saccharothrix sp. ST-888]